ncbi:MAG: nicotinate (nicotinamide) nucleotide adenylyltransferase [Spirochaetes bacterium]|nr:nicotinate (nicotinamide) nucleotide adenylyltransferase [Spirochaetota bacterium]MBU1079414.1 nicotinate (nicotinamide) nucleotide adenylyltransferase [Spirochaetota bacterium]
MRLLVVGGTFNPLHIGHLMLAEEVASEFGYDRVALVPSFIPPHKAVSGDPGPEARLAMVSAAVSGDPLYVVEGCELRRGGVSYTVDTLDHIARSYGLEGKPGLVIGDDLAAGFAQWRDPEGVCERSDLIVARRTGAFPPLPYPYRAANNCILPVSSTDIRTRIASGRPWRRLVPAPVYDFIRSREIYSYARGPR